MAESRPARRGLSLASPWPIEEAKKEFQVVSSLRSLLAVTCRGLMTTAIWNDGIRSESSAAKRAWLCSASRCTSAVAGVRATVIASPLASRRISEPSRTVGLRRMVTSPSPCTREGVTRMVSATATAASTSSCVLAVAEAGSISSATAPVVATGVASARRVACGMTIGAACIGSESSVSGDGLTVCRLDGLTVKGLVSDTGTVPVLPPVTS